LCIYELRDSKAIHFLCLCFRLKSFKRNDFDFVAVEKYLSSKRNFCEIDKSHFQAKQCLLLMKIEQKHVSSDPVATFHIGYRSQLDYKGYLVLLGRMPLAVNTSGFRWGNSLAERY